MEEMGTNVYIEPVKHRTTIEIDQALLDEAREVLGTSGIRETVEVAMREAIDVERRRRLAQRIVTGEGIDTGPEMLAEVRPTR
jgi:Arc/MetJ family transcription regulator